MAVVTVMEMEGGGKGTAGHGGAVGHQKGGRKEMLLSHHTQRKTERSSYEGVTNEPAHKDTGPHCPPGPDGPWNKSPPAGTSCPCQSCSSGPDTHCPGCCGHQLPIHPPCASCLGCGESRSVAGWEAALCITAGAKKEAFLWGELLIPCACEVSVVQLL